MSDFLKFRAQYPNFIYHGYEIEAVDGFLKIKYHFETEGLCHFQPEWTLKIKENFSSIDKTLLENTVFSLGLVELVSYWKATCSPRVIIKPHGLSQTMTDWWKKLYFNGLGEFFYVNKIHTDIDSFMDISSTGDILSANNNSLALKGSLVPVGGGKDSAVTLNVLRSLKSEINPYIINGRGATNLTCEVAGYNDNEVITVKRTIDKNLIDLNSKGFLNGHTPFSAIVAFSSILSAILNSKKYVVLSNESSANESTVLGESINHQFSKGEDFENDFIDYEKKYINSGVEYFSFLRPLSELQIAMLFAKYKEFHKVFKSCNAGSKTDIWCCNCPKCLFVYIILSPFLSEEELTDIFGENLLDKEELLDIYKQLSGVYENKPFECVGSRDEVIVSSRAALDKLINGNCRIPHLLQFFGDSTLHSDNDINYYVNFYDKKHHLPPAFEEILVDELKEQLGYVLEN